VIRSAKAKKPICSSFSLANTKIFPHNPPKTYYIAKSYIWVLSTNILEPLKIIHCRQGWAKKTFFYDFFDDDFIFLKISLLNILQFNV
jgi:hypothetical protein